MNPIDRFLTEALERLDSPLTSGMWFIHQSAFGLFNIIKPQTYRHLRTFRSAKYLRKRKETEKEYNELRGEPNRELSYTYATVLGYTRMRPEDDYPGYTYYFKLTKSQIDKCIFEVVDKKFNLEPIMGYKGLVECMKYWKSHESQMKDNARLEVVIPFNVTPAKYYPQEEDR